MKLQIWPGKCIVTFQLKLIKSDSYDDDDDDDDDGAHLRDDRIKGEGVLYCKLEKKWVG